MIKTIPSTSAKGPANADYSTDYGDKLRAIGLELEAIAGEYTDQ
jgi:hypothetical protein